MLNPTTALGLALWVNGHDDGTDQPRATVVDEGGRIAIDIKSTVFFLDGSAAVETDRVFGMQSARNVLGY